MCDILDFMKLRQENVIVASALAFGLFQKNIISQYDFRRGLLKCKYVKIHVTFLHSTVLERKFIIMVKINVSEVDPAELLFLDIISHVEYKYTKAHDIS